MRQSIVELDRDIQVHDVQIAGAEDKLNRIIYCLYDLTSAEIALIEGNQQRGK